VNPDRDPRVVAEDAQAYLAARGSVDVENLGDVVLRHVPYSPHYWFGAATRPRFGDADAHDRIAAVRQWFRERGREEFMWMVGESATPADLVDRLVSLGAELDDEDPIAMAMVLDHEPEPGPPDVETRRVTTFEDFRAASLITLSDAPPETVAETEAKLASTWDEVRENHDRTAFLALIDERPIATANLVWLSNGLPYLGGAATLTEYRGRGAFRALVRARWDEAASRGVRVLLVQAGKMSHPIFLRLGFETTARITMLRDGSSR
jgi:GNAT superfamily N-acetyltransferase